MNANTPHHSEIDTTIDRALSTLRDAQPRSGLEHRILASLEHRAVTTQPNSFHISAHLTLWTATAAAMIAVASLVVLHHHVTPAEIAHGSQSAVILSERSESKNPETASRATNPEPISNTSSPRTTHALSSRPARAARSRETPVFENARIAEPQNTAATTPTDAQALADLHAPSRPAPPLPLTPQEKQFVRMLRYGNLTQLAELNPEVRAKQAADETAAFKAFFPDPPPLQQPNGDTE